jgi:hypothetical protein
MFNRNMGVKDKYNKLSPAERDFVWWNAIAAINFNENASTALAEAQKRFGASTLHNGSGDSFRHCFWSAMNARDQGIAVARKFGEAHEDWVGNPANEKTMDLHNNSVGFDIGGWSIGATDRHLAVLCVEAWVNKKLIQIDSAKGSDLVYSNSYEKKLYR